MERPTTQNSKKFDNAGVLKSKASLADSASSLEILRGAAADAIALLLSPSLIRSPHRTQAQIVRIPSPSHSHPHISLEACASRAFVPKCHRYVLLKPPFAPSQPFSPHNLLHLHLHYDCGRRSPCSPTPTPCGRSSASAAPTSPALPRAPAPLSPPSSTPGGPTPRRRRRRRRPKSRRLTCAALQGTPPPRMRKIFSRKIWI